MAKLFKKNVVIASFCISSVAALFTSCGSAEVQHSNYIPANACAVLNINTEEIFSDAFFDLIANNDLTDDVASGPLSDLIKNPANAGIERLTKYHLFATGSNFMDAKMGAILPLNDSELFADYIENNFDVEVLSENGFLIADITLEHKIVWNETTAIYYYGAFGGDLIKEAEGLFKQEAANSLAAKDSTFAHALNNDAHLNAWFKNDDFVNMVDSGLEMAFKFKLFETLNIKKEAIRGAKSLFMVNFNNGNIKVSQRQYLTPTQINVHNGFDKPNNISGLLPMASNQDPLFASSISLKPEGLVDFLKEYNIDKAWDKQMENSPIKFKINQLSEFFEGDILALVNGFDEVEKKINTTDMDDEGNDIVTQKTIKTKTPQLSIGLTVKNPTRLKGILNLFASALPKVEGFSNLNDELYFALKEEHLFITTTPQGITALNNLTGKLTPELTKLISAHRTSAYINIGGIINQGDSKTAALGFIEGVGNLKNIIISEKGVDKDGIVKGETTINFSNKDNGLISIIKLFQGIGKAVGPMVSAFL